MNDERDRGTFKTWPRGRTCEKCRRPLSIYNPNATCWACTVIYLKSSDNRGRVTKVLAEKDVFFRGTVCSSRETPGFHRAHVDYHGQGPDR